MDGWISKRSFLHCVKHGPRKKIHTPDGLCSPDQFKVVCKDNYVGAPDVKIWTYSYLRYKHNLDLHSMMDSVSLIKDVEPEKWFEV